MIVVDTNVLVRLFVVPDIDPDAALLLERDPEWAAPTIALSELRNVLLGFLRRGDMDAAQAKARYDSAELALGDRVTSVVPARVIDTALECGLSAYDAEFVVLARMLGVFLATSDREILEGAPDVAVSVREAIGRARRQ